MILRGAPETLTYGQAEREVAGGDLTLGGSGALMAHAAARLGLRTAFVGLVGTDRAADFVLDALTDGGVDVTGVTRDPSLGTAMTVIFVRPDGDRAMLTFPGALSAFGTEHVDETVLRNTRHVHAASLFLQPRLAQALPALFTAAREGGAVTSLDTNDDPSGRWVVEQEALPAVVDYLMPNEREAVALSPSVCRAKTPRSRRRGRWRPTDPSSQSSAAARAPLPWERARIRTGYSARRSTPAPTARPQSSTRVGAGDTFDAGLVAGLSQGLHLPDALRLAVAAGTSSVSRAGGADGQPTAAEAAELAERVVVEVEE